MLHHMVCCYFTSNRMADAPSSSYASSQHMLASGKKTACTHTLIHSVRAAHSATSLLTHMLQLNPSTKATRNKLKIQSKGHTPRITPNFMLSLLEADILLHTPGLQSLCQNNEATTWQWAYANRARQGVMTRQGHMQTYAGQHQW
jgi:hypothetical protein